MRNEQSSPVRRDKIDVRVFFQLVALAAILFGASGAYARAHSAAGPAHDRPEDLKLTMRVVDQSYCYHGTDMFSTVLALRLRFVNESEETIILRKDMNAKAEVLVSTSPADQQRGMYEYRGMPPFPTPVKDRLRYGNMPDERFVSLKPGQTYETDDNVEIPVTREGLHPFRDSVSAGRHVLTIRYYTWLEGQSLADQLRTRWNSQGLLFSNVIASEPTGFEVAPNLETETCQK